MEHKFSSVMSVEKFRLRRFASINDVPIQTAVSLGTHLIATEKRALSVCGMIEFFTTHNQAQLSIA